MFDDPFHAAVCRKCGRWMTWKEAIEGDKMGDNSYYGLVHHNGECPEPTPPTIVIIDGIKTGSDS